jgi:hypothetical protein
MWFDGEYLNKIIESELKAQSNRELVGQPFSIGNPQSDYHKAKNLFDELYSAYTKAVKK